MNEIKDVTKSGDEESLLIHELCVTTGQKGLLLHIGQRLELMCETRGKTLHMKDECKSSC